MNKEKQIEEMKREVNTALARDCSRARCLTCEFINEENCEPSIIAEHFYNAGYRRQSEGEWKIMKMGDGERVRTCSSCLISQSVNVYKGKVMFRYCPYCGAKMKGEE